VGWFSHAILFNKFWMTPDSDRPNAVTFSRAYDQFWLVTWNGRTLFTAPCRVLHPQKTNSMHVCVCLFTFINFFLTSSGFPRSVFLMYLTNCGTNQAPYLLGTRGVKLITCLTLEPRLRLHGHITLLCHTSSWFGASSYKLHGVTYGPSESLTGKICTSMKEKRKLYLSLYS